MGYFGRNHVSASCLCQVPNATETLSHSNDHPPAHAHVKGEGKTTRIGANGKPLKGDPELSPTQKRVVERNLAEIRNAINKIRRWWKYQYHLKKHCQ